MPNSTDPFGDVYKATIAAVKLYAPLVQDKNLVDWSIRSNTRKETVTGADVPELDLRITNLALVPGYSSCSTSAVLTLELYILGNDKNLTVVLTPLLWQLVKVLYQLKFGTVYDDVTLSDKRIVTTVEHTSGTTGLADGLTARGISGWSSIWSVDLHMNIPNADLLT